MHRFFCFLFFFSVILVCMHCSVFGQFPSQRFEATALVQVNIVQVSHFGSSLEHVLHNPVPSRCSSQLNDRVDLHIEFGIGH